MDINDTIREVMHEDGYAKQGAAYGFSGVKGVNAKIAALSSPTCAPVIAASRLRKGNVVSGHGAERMVTDAIATAHAAGATGQVMVQGRLGVLPPRPHGRRGRRQSLVLSHRPDELLGATGDLFNPRQYLDHDPLPRAIWDTEDQRWISEAEVDETTFTAFTSHPKKRQVPCRLLVRRVQRLNKATVAATKQEQDQLFTTWRHHGFVTNSTLTRSPRMGPTATTPSSNR